MVMDGEIVMVSRWGGRIAGVGTRVSELGT